MVLPIGLTSSGGAHQHGGGLWPSLMAKQLRQPHQPLKPPAGARPHRADAAQSQPWLRLSAIMIAMLAGYAA